MLRDVLKQKDYFYPDQERVHWQDSQHADTHNPSRSEDLLSSKHSQDAREDDTA